MNDITQNYSNINLKTLSNMTKEDYEFLESKYSILEKSTIDVAIKQLEVIKNLERNEKLSYIKNENGVIEFQVFNSNGK